MQCHWRSRIAIQAGYKIAFHARQIQWKTYATPIILYRFTADFSLEEKNHQTNSILLFSFFSDVISVVVAAAVVFCSLHTECAYAYQKRSTLLYYYVLWWPG